MVMETMTCAKGGGGKGGQGGSSRPGGGKPPSGKPTPVAPGGRGRPDGKGHGA